jgi:hypothetical protein
MDLEDWIDRHCRDGDNLEINRDRDDNIFVVNGRSRSAFVIQRSVLAAKRKGAGKQEEKSELQKELERMLDDLLDDLLPP